MTKAVPDWEERRPLDRQADLHQEKLPVEVRAEKQGVA
jgi:hypothetical protein